MPLQMQSVNDCVDSKHKHNVDKIYIFYIHCNCMNSLLVDVMRKWSCFYADNIHRVLKKGATSFSTVTLASLHGFLYHWKQE